MDSFKDTCREHGLRITPQRTAIFEEVSGSDDHPNADAVYRRVRRRHPNISFDTVNRTLNLLSQIGILRVVEGYGEPRRYDSNGDSHHHLRCLKCGRIFDFHSESYDGLQVPLELNTRFTVLAKRVVLEGFCYRCRRKKR